jgi:hypothetical protein
LVGVVRVGHPARLSAHATRLSAFLRGVIDFCARVSIGRIIVLVARVFAVLIPFSSGLARSVIDFACFLIGCIIDLLA